MQESENMIPLRWGILNKYLLRLRCPFPNLIPDEVVVPFHSQKSFK